MKILRNFSRDLVDCNFIFMHYLYVFRFSEMNVLSYNSVGFERCSSLQEWYCIFPSAAGLLRKHSIRSRVDKMSFIMWKDFL